MARSLRTLSLWYPFFFIALIVIVVMFWFNYQKVYQQKNYTKVQEEVINPLPDKLNTGVIEDLKKRIVIEDTDVANLQISSRKLSSSSAMMKEQEIVEPTGVNRISTKSSDLIRSQTINKTSTSSAL